MAGADGPKSGTQWIQLDKVCRHHGWLTFEVKLGAEAARHLSELCAERFWQGAALSTREQQLAAVRALIADERDEQHVASGPLGRACRLRLLCRATTRNLPAWGSA